MMTIRCLQWEGSKSVQQALEIELTEEEKNRLDHHEIIPAVRLIMKRTGKGLLISKYAADIYRQKSLA